MRWGNVGDNTKHPDLQVRLGGTLWNVECCIHTKSLALFFFLRELLEKTDQQVRVRYDKWLPFSLPNGLNRCAFLDEVLSQTLGNLETAKRKAAMESPQVLYSHPASSLHVYVEGEGSYNPAAVPKRTGCPEQYLEHALQEAIDNKQEENDLD